MQTQRILVTGASGFIGGHICDYLYQSGYDVLGCGRRKTPPSWWDHKIEYQSVDLLKEVPLIKDIRCIIHVAGLADDRSSLKDLSETNVSGTARLIKAMPDGCGFIYISSASVFPLDRKVHDEERIITINDNLSNYGKSKLMAEQLLHCESARCSHLTILRPRAVYGPRDGTLLPRLARLLKRGTVYFPGDGQARISLTHVFNLCIAVRLSLEGKANGTFNIADGQTYLMKEVLHDVLTTTEPLRWRSLPLSLFRMLADFTGWLSLRSAINHQSLDYLNKSMILNITKARLKLGYIPRFDLSDFLTGEDVVGIRSESKKIIKASDIERLNIKLVDR